MDSRGHALEGTQGLTQSYNEVVTKQDQETSHGGPIVAAMPVK